MCRAWLHCKGASEWQVKSGPLSWLSADSLAARLQLIPRQELPRARDVELVEALATAVVLLLRNRRERPRQVHDADRGIVQHLVAGALDDVHALHVSIPVETHGQHQLPVQLPAPRFIGVIEVADAL